MNIVDALKIAKEQGKKVSPVGAEWFVEFDNEINTYVKKLKKSNINCISIYIDDVSKDWKVVWEKPSKETQYKIDSMKFQIVRHCKNTTVNDNTNCTKCIITEICDKTFNKNGETPYNNALDGWRLKEIVEAYHILKEAGEI